MAKPSIEEFWRGFLEGTDPALLRMRRFMHRLPSAPRCKMCAAPFARPGSFLVRPFGLKRWAANSALCTICTRGLDKEVGGVEIEATFLFADIRESTAIAERASPAEFHAMLERFYVAAAKAVDVGGGLVDKYLGDGVVALFVPAFTIDVSPALAAIRAGQALLEAMGSGTHGDAWLPVGVGVHSGPAFVGVMGTPGGALDFTGVGDTVNIAARLGSVAGAGELLVSDATAQLAGISTASLERRRLDLKGRGEPVDVVVLGPSTGSTVGRTAA
jgi:adenylate cyclase